MKNCTRAHVCHAGHSEHIYPVVATVADAEPAAVAEPNGLSAAESGYVDLSAVAVTDAVVAGAELAASVIA